MDVPMVWVISPDPDSRRLIGLNLNKPESCILEASPQNGLVTSCADPQLIILDVEPPDESGWEAASAQRQSPRLQGVPLILVLADAPTASRLVPLQPVRWPEKPLAIDALLTLVRESLAGKEWNVKGQMRSLGRWDTSAARWTH